MLRIVILILRKKEKHNKLGVEYCVYNIKNEIIHN